MRASFQRSRIERCDAPQVARRIKLGLSSFTDRTPYCCIAARVSTRMTRALLLVAPAFRQRSHITQPLGLQYPICKERSAPMNRRRIPAFELVRRKSVLELRGFSDLDVDRSLECAPAS